MTTTEVTLYNDEAQALAIASQRTALAVATAKAIISGAIILPPHAREAGAAAAIILAGLELGMRPMEALRGLYLVEGRVVVAADVQLALVMRHGVRIRWIEASDTVARMEIVRPGSDPLEWAYTMAQAKTAGLAGRKTWQAHPGPMLRARCITSAIRAYCPDLLAATYSPDEAADFGSTAPASQGRAYIDATPEPDEATHEDLQAAAREVGSAATQEWAAKQAGKPGAWYREQISAIRAKAAKKAIAAPPADEEPEGPPASDEVERPPVGGLAARRKPAEVAS